MHESTSCRKCGAMLIKEPPRKGCISYCPKCDNKDTEKPTSFGLLERLVRGLLNRISDWWFWVDSKPVAATLVIAAIVGAGAIWCWLQTHTIQLIITGP